jgi:hypothetical protein
VLLPVAGDQHVARLEVAVDDAALMRVLDAFADRLEEPDALLERQLVAIAIRRQRLPFDQLHYEVGLAPLRLARVEDLGDRRVIHRPQRTPLQGKALEYLTGRHALAHDLERHPPPHRPTLLRDVDDAEAAFAQLLQDLVRADLRGGAARGPSGGACICALCSPRSRLGLRPRRLRQVLLPPLLQQQGIEGTPNRLLLPGMLPLDPR